MVPAREDDRLSRVLGNQSRDSAALKKIECVHHLRWWYGTVVTTARVLCGAVLVYSFKNYFRSDPIESGKVN